MNEKQATFEKFVVSEKKRIGILTVTLSWMSWMKTRLDLKFIIPEKMNKYSLTVMVSCIWFVRNEFDHEIVFLMNINL